jgi:ferredoxin
MDGPIVRDRHAIRIAGTDGGFSCYADETVLKAMERAPGFGFAVSGGRRIAVGCRQGGCGVCRVQVLSGAYRTGPMSRAHVSVEEEGEGYALACRLYPQGDLTLRPARKAPAQTPATQPNP